jgi:type IV secretion system protein VirB4
MTCLSRILRDYREAGAIDSLVPVHAAIDERTWVTVSGDLLSVLQATPRDGECLDSDQADHVARRFESVLRVLDANFRVYQYVLRRSHPGVTSQPSGNPVVDRLLRNREAYFRSRAGSLFTLDTYVVVVYTGWRPKTNWRAAFSRSLSTDATGAALEAELTRASGYLAEKVDSLVVQLRDVLPLALCDRDDAFRFFRRLLNYAPEKSESGRLSCTSYLGFQAADSALECHRDHLRLDDHFVQVLTLKEPPSRTFARLLGDLQDLPIPFILASEWKRLDPGAARRILHTRRRHHHTAKISMVSYLTSSSQATTQDQLVDESAVTLGKDLGACLEELEVHGKSLGEFSLSVVLYDRDLAAVRRASAECFKVFAAHDARAVEERYNGLNAWLAVIPGNDARNVRRLWLTNSNYADLSFLFSHQSGEPVNAHLGAEYLAAFETQGATPYYLNLHAGDVAHTLAVGATGSGKSFLLNFLIAQAMKYDPLVFIFDLGGSYAKLTELFRGGYTSLASRGGQGANAPGAINPFCLPPTPENLHFLASFVRVLIESGGYVMTTDDDKDLFEQIENVYALEPEQRRLLTLSQITNRNLRAQLTKWVQGGPYASWFDNPADTVTLASFQTFDFEGLSDYPQVLEPLVFYVLHRANALLTSPETAGRFKVFVLDEAWRFFQHPAIKAYVTEALKTWRKKNAAMILATQSVEDLRSSELLPVVVESCPTKLFLANPGMDRTLYQTLFHLNQTESARIATLVPKREFLLKRADFAKVLTLNVDPESHRLFSSGATPTAHPQPRSHHS